MAKKTEENDNLFQRLTKLFRSGPVVKRKIRAYKDKPASSSHDVFKKTLSHVYSTAMSSYGAYDRMCVDLNTLIAVPGPEEFISLKDLMTKHPNGEKFIVYAYDHEKKAIVPAWAHHPRSSGFKDTVKITFDDESELICTSDHPCMMRDGTYRDAGDLKENDSMMPFCRPSSQEMTDEEYMSANLQASISIPRFVLSVTPWKILEVGDLTVDGYENFATAGHILHNSRYSDFAEMQYCLHGDTKIAIPGGFKTIKELSEEYGLDKEFIVYSYDHSKKQIVPAFAKQARKTRTDYALKVTFENGQEIIGTPDHMLMLRDGSYRRIDQLQIDDAMMPFIREKINFEHEEQKDKLTNSKLIKFEQILELCKYHKNFSIENVAEYFDVNVETIEKSVQEKSFKNFDNFKFVYAFSDNCVKRSCQDYFGIDDDFPCVRSIEYYGTIDLYDLTVDKYKNFATDSVISHNTPEVSAACDVYCLTGDNTIPLLNGKISTIQTLYEEEAKDFYVYSYDIETNKYVPGLCKQVKMTGRNQPIVKVEFDDGTFIRVTSNHRILLHDNTYCEAGKLIQGQSIRALNKRTSSFAQGDKLQGYEQIHLDDGTWKSTHRCIAEYFEPRGKGVVHHVNHNKKDNTPENLRFMSWKEHQELHRHENSLRWKNDEVYIEKMKAIHSARMTKLNEDPLFKKRVAAARKATFDAYTDEQKKEIFARSGDKNGMFGSARFGEKNPRWNPNFRREFTKEELVNLIMLGVTFDNAVKNLNTRSVILTEHCKKFGIKKWSKCYALIVSPELTAPIISELKKYASKDNIRNFGKICEKIGKTRNECYDVINACGYKNWGAFIDSNNHKVVRVIQDGIEDVYDLTVEKFHNFAAGIGSKVSFIIVHNSEEVASSDDKGKVLHIYSENRQIARLLEELFYDTLNIEFNLTPWVRSLIVYGDFFLFNDVSTEHGILNVMPIPVNEIEREEGYDPTDPLAVRFRWVTQGNQALENWQVTHFRLLGNDAFLPYGSSVLEPARRIWRQLILIEDAMLVYRVVRSPERRVFYIDVGSVAPEEVPNYMEQAKAILRSNQIADSKSGKVDLRYNPLCYASNTTIPLLDGRNPTIKELSEMWANGERDLETYSIDNEKGGQIVPGKIVWAGKSGRTKQMTTITLDDGGILEVTPDHKMMRRDGSVVRAKDLVQGDSLMPFYAKNKLISNEAEDEKNKGYEVVFNPVSNSFVYTHRLVMSASKNIAINENGLLKIGGHTVHHKNFNKHDNSTKNLQLMTNKEHSAYHAKLAKENIIKYNKSDAKRLKTIEDNKKYQKAEKMGSVYNGSELHKEHNSIRKDAQLKSWSENKENRKAAMRFRWDENCQAIAISRIRASKSFISMDNFTKMLSEDEEFMKYYSELNSHLARDPKKSCHKNGVGKFITKDYKDWKSLWIAHNPHSLGRSYVNNVDISSQTQVTNHKVAGVMTVDVEEQDVYNVTVDKYHNLVVGGKNAKKSLQLGECAVGFILAFQSVDEDYFIPVRGNESNTRIDTLAGGTNVTAIEDVEYIQKKLFAALKVPKAYLSYSEDMSSKSTLCLHQGTKVRLQINNKDFTMTISQLSDWMSSKDFAPKNDIFAHVWDGNKDVLAKINWCHATKTTDTAIEVIHDKGSVLCTPEHQFICCDYVTSENILVEAQNLIPNSENYCIQGEFGDKINIKFVKQTNIPSQEFYDLEVDHESHNFLLGCGIYVHNSQIDIRFSRTINNIQRTVLSELNKLAVIHLYSHGFEGDDLLDFELTLSNPSTVAQQQKLEIYRTRLEIAGSAPDGMVDRYWIRKNIMGMTDDEIERIEKGRIDDKIADLKIEGITGEAPEAGGGGSSGGGGGGAPSGGGLPEITPPGEEGAEGALGADNGGAGGAGGTEPGEAPEVGEEPDKGGETKKPGEEEEEPDEDKLFASQEKQGKILDEDDDPSFVPYSIEDEDAPLKAQAEVQKQLKKVLYNRSRRKTHGPKALDEPDVLKAVSHKRHGDTLTDPYDMHKTMSIDPFKESIFDEIPQSRVSVQRRLSGNLQSTLKSLEKRISSTAPPKIITEDVDNSIDNIYEFELEDEVKDDDNDN